MKRTAFSLVELSIVLVILGLLVGGILAGQSLIRASELRAVTAEHQRYTAAIHAFRDKYFAIPGDMTNATSFWGRMLNSAYCPTSSAASVISTGTCDGDGDSGIKQPASSNVPGEAVAFWRQLALAGLIEGSFSGRSGSGGQWESLINTNVPASRLPSAGWSVQLTNDNGTGARFGGNFGNAFFFGAEYPVSATLGPIISPEEAWNIDTKTDDGRPATGKLLVIWYSPCTNASGPADTAATYKLTNPAKACALEFVKNF